MAPRIVNGVQQVLPNYSTDPCWPEEPPTPDRLLHQATAASSSHLVESVWLVRFVEWARGDPRLSASEELFLTDLGRLAAQPDGVRISFKQAAILREVEARLREAPRPDDEADEG